MVACVTRLRGCSSPTDDFDAMIGPHTEDSKRSNLFVPGMSNSRARSLDFNGRDIGGLVSIWQQARTRSTIFVLRASQTLGEV